MGNIDLNNLNEDNIKYLMTSLKYPSKQLDIEDIKNQLLTLKLSKFKKDTIVLGIIDDIEYILHIYFTKRINIDPRYSIHIRFKETNEHLIRVDIGSGHHNPEGFPDCSHVDHIHIYNPNFEDHDCIAYPLSDYNFPNIQNIVEAFNEFLEYTNVKLGGENDERKRNGTGIS